MRLKLSATLWFQNLLTAKLWFQPDRNPLFFYSMQAKMRPLYASGRGHFMGIATIHRYLVFSSLPESEHFPCAKVLQLGRFETVHP